LHVAVVQSPATALHSADVSQRFSIANAWPSSPQRSRSAAVQRYSPGMQFKHMRFSTPGWQCRTLLHVRMSVTTPRSSQSYITPAESQTDLPALPLQTAASF
jgi:hypothetical protein